MADDLARLLLGPGPSGYGTSQVMGAILTEWNPTTYENKVSDGANRWTNLPVSGPAVANLVTGRVWLVKTAGLPILAGNLYVADVQA